MRNFYFFSTIIILLLGSVQNLTAQEYIQDVKYYKARITNIEVMEIEDGETPYTQTVFSLNILDSDRIGQTKTVTFKGKDNMPQSVKYKVNENIFIGINSIQQNNQLDEYISFYDIDNSFGIYLIIITFIIALLAAARFRGLVYLVGLIITMLLLIFIFVPLTLKGFPPLISSVGISLISIVITVPLITGLSKKTINAITGATSGIIISVIFTLIFGWTMHLSGIITDELLSLFYITNININLRDIALSGMIISSLGAVIDISVSISSSINEIFSAHPELTFQKAFKSALEVGKDNLGSMVNTLIMAYVGSSLSLILLIALKAENNMPIMMIIGHNEVLIEILKSFVGCMGMIASVPITAYVGTKLYLKKVKASA